MDKAPVTNLLLEIEPQETSPQVLEQLFERVYDELRVMAAALLRRERGNHTLQPTALVNEAYLRLVEADRVGWEGRAHFFGVAARAMRQILVDHARRKKAGKRLPPGHIVSVETNELPCRDAQIDLITLDDILTELARLDERMAAVVELRVFGGLKNREVARVLGVSERTIEGDWAMAKKWLRREMA